MPIGFLFAFLSEAHQFRKELHIINAKRCISSTAVAVAYHQFRKELHIINAKRCISSTAVAVAYHQFRKELHIIIAKAFFDTHLKV